MKEEKMYAVFGDVCKDKYGIDIKCFGVFTNKNAAEHIRDSLIGTKYVYSGLAWVKEMPLDQEVEIPIARYIE